MILLRKTDRLLHRADSIKWVSPLSKVTRFKVTNIPSTMKYNACCFSTKEIVVSKWSQNPYIRGTWSDPVIGTDSTAFANMAGRIKNMFFAGEATHADWYGYMQGGYFSGLDRAKEIASCIEGKKCDSYQPSTSLPVIIKAQECKSKASRKKSLTVSLLVALIFFSCF